MTIGLYAATVPAWRQQLGAIKGVLEKAKAWCAEQGVSEADLIEVRLIADMFPLGYQVKSCAVHSLGAIEGVRAGRFSPDMGGWAQDFEGLKARIEAADVALAAIDPAEVDAFVGRDVAFVRDDLRMDFAAEDFLLSFSMPNFYFHASIGYAILRGRGVPLGKRDFSGRPRLRG